MRLSEIELDPELHMLDVNGEVLKLTDLVEAVETLGSPERQC